MLHQAMIFFKKDKRGACFALKIKLKLSNVTDKNFYINFLINFKRSAHYCWTKGGVLRT